MHISLRYCVLSTAGSLMEQEDCVEVDSAANSYWQISGYTQCIFTSANMTTTKLIP